MKRRVTPQQTIASCCAGGQRAYSKAVETDPGRLAQAVDEQCEVTLLVGVLHSGQGPVQRFAQVQSTSPVQGFLHHTVRYSAEHHGL